MNVWFIFGRMVPEFSIERVAERTSRPTMFQKCLKKIGGIPSGRCSCCTQFTEIRGHHLSNLLLILNNPTIFISQLRDEVPPISLGCSTMKIASVEVTNLKPLQPRSLVPHSILLDH